MAKKKFGRDLGSPLAPTYNEPKKITKAQANKVSEIAKSSNANLKAQNKAAKKSKLKSTLIKAGTGIGIAAKVVYDAYHRNIQNDYSSTYKNAGGANYMPYGDSPSNKELRKWKKSRK